MGVRAYALPGLNGRMKMRSGRSWSNRSKRQKSGRLGSRGRRSLSCGRRCSRASSSSSCRSRLCSVLPSPRMSPDQLWLEMRAAFASLQDEMRSQGPPSEWCRTLLRLGCSDPVHKPRLSREERSHITCPITREKLECFAPSAQETVYRAHEMCVALTGDARWDPTGLLALPPDVIVGLRQAFERRGCGKQFGIEDAMCLPFLLYSSDTVHILRLSSAMRGLRSFRGSCSARAANAELGNYAGVICALVEAGGLLRHYVNPSRLLPVLSLQSSSFFDNQHLVFRGLWLPNDFDVDDLCRCYNLTSWSLWVRGALSVLRVYKGRVDPKANVPVLLVALRTTIMQLALPTTALYSAASPDGKEIGKEDRPNECLPKSRHRPQRNDSGVAQGEKEIVLPPFCHLKPVEGIGTVSLASLRNVDLLGQLVSEWHLNPGDADWLHWELNTARHEAVKGRKSLSDRDVDRCLCLFIRDVQGSWFDNVYTD